jgi:hypothetical protein
MNVDKMQVNVYLPSNNPNTNPDSQW